jgi:hypothetical protein
VSPSCSHSSLEFVREERREGEDVMGTVGRTECIEHRVVLM